MTKCQPSIDSGADRPRAGALAGLVLLQSARAPASRWGASSRWRSSLAAWTTRAPLLLSAARRRGALAAAAGIAWAFRPARDVPSDARVARSSRSARPSLDDRLVSAVDLALVGRAAARSAVSCWPTHRRRAAGVDPRRDRAGRRRCAAPGFRPRLALLLVAALVFAGRGTFARRRDALALTLFPSRVALEVTPGSVACQSGSPLTIEATLVGQLARRSSRSCCAPTSMRARSRPIGRPPRWLRSAGTFTLALDSVDRARSSTASSPALFASPIFDVTVARAPRVTRIDVEYTYPAALRLAPRVEEDSGDIYAPAGTDVRLRVLTDRRGGGRQMTLGRRTHGPIGARAAHAGVGCVEQSTTTVVSRRARRPRRA